MVRLTRVGVDRVGLREFGFGLGVGRSVLPGAARLLNIIVRRKHKKIAYHKGPVLYFFVAETILCP